LLADELIMVMGSTQLSVNLRSVDSHSLLLLVGLLLVGEEVHTWLWHGGPHRDHRDGQEHWGALRHWCGGDGDTQGFHVAPSGAREPELPPSPQATPLLSKESSNKATHYAPSL
jgi:hypothetical protein